MEGGRINWTRKNAGFRRGQLGFRHCRRREKVGLRKKSSIGSLETDRRREKLSATRSGGVGKMGMRKKLVEAAGGGRRRPVAAGSLRCVAIAYRTCETEKVLASGKELENWDMPEGDLILLEIVGIKDGSFSACVREAVKLCDNAGVK
ncbi:Calcium-transporting ATPase 10, plasma membrane-type [Orobanche gracilis]